MSEKFSVSSRLTKFALVSAIGMVLVILTAANVAAAGGPNTAIVNLQHTPTGTANLQYFPQSKKLVVTISLLGLAPNSKHPEHIHVGSCNKPGGIKYMLNDLYANKKGQGSATTVISNVKSSIPATGWYINVHNGPNLQPANQYTPIACGNIMNLSHAGSILAPLGPSPNPNESATGFAQISLKHGKLTVAVIVRGLAPNSAHAAHIHAGDCFYTRQVLYDFSPLVANGNGVATKIKTFDVSSSVTIPAAGQNGWVINIHYSTNLSTQTGYNPILCGNAVPYKLAA